MKAKAVIGKPAEEIDLKAPIQARILPLLWFFTVAANLFVFIFIGYSIYESRVNLNQSAQTETENLATILDYSLSEKVRRLEFVLMTAAREFERQQKQGGIQAEQLTNYLQWSQLSQTELDGLRMTDAHGIITYNRSVANGNARVSLADRDYFIYLRDHPAAETYVGKAVKSRVTGRLILPVARRLSDLQGQFAGMVYATIWIEELARQFRGINIGEDGAFYLLDDSFHLITSYAQSDSVELPVGADSSPNDFLDLRAQIAAGALAGTYIPKETIDGIRRIHSFRKLPSASLIVIAAKSENTYLAPWYHLSIRYTGFGCLFLIISILSMRSIERDIRERRRAEQALQQAKDAAEAANHAKTRFLAMMSHELRTPLNGVLGMAQMLMYPGIEEDERIEFASTINESGELLLRLLNDVLDHAKIEAGKLDLAREAYVPDQLLKDMLGLFGEVAKKKGLSLSIVGDGVAQTCWGDRNRLRQILINLVNNALKFTEHGGAELSVSLKVLNEQAPSSPEALLVRFCVKDSGIGISAEKQSALFKPFSQVDDSSTRRFSGTGLGLTICMQLVHLMGGEMGLESDEGHGSMFWFELPVEMETMHVPSHADLMKRSERVASS